ncbi:MAG: LysM peptidoglycan-binding domain-containing protein [Acidimicrobiia bacterium]|nr:LysM peptidoglycan-binding domain-containing protein [Acidimicrobiia bacterium]
MQKCLRARGFRRISVVTLVTAVLLGILPAAVASADTTYTVKAGDTVQGIAKRFGVPWKALASANGLGPPYTIVVGRTLQIPSAGQAATGSSGGSGGGGGRIGPGSYVVVKGDSVWKIAQRAGVSWRAVADANGLGPPYIIVVGRTLVIPAAGSGGAGARGGAANGSVGSGPYRVVKGDSVWKIAARAGVSWRAVADANGLGPPYLIRPGQTLQIPGEGTSDTGGGAGTPAPAPQAVQPGVHTVRKGETLGQIARAYGTSVDALARANGMSDPNRVWIGQRIRIVPADQATPPPGGSPAPTGGVGAALDHWARYYGLPPDLVKGVATVESGWQPDVVSSAGAVGVMQLMPGTAEWVGSALIGRPINRWDANQNVQGGSAYLRWLLDQTGGNERLAIAAYSQGLGAVRRNGVYAESEVYVSKVQGARRRYR